MKFACGVVLYNPSDDNIKSLIEINKDFDCFFVWDNSDNNEHYICKIEEFTNEYIFLKKNQGLAKPYNYFLDLCEKNNIDILCILDQDTLLDSKKIKKMKKSIAIDFSDRYAVYAPRLIGTTDKNWVINSNSFLNVRVLKDNSIRYDEFYYLDRLDADLCKQIIKKRLRIKIYEDVIVDHKIGESNTGNHSPIRHYYMFKNRRYYNYKFYHPVHAKMRFILQDIKHIFLIVLYEKEKKDKINQLFKGIHDYKIYLKEKQDNKRENI